jgi:hypothetical protein
MTPIKIFNEYSFPKSNMPKIIPKNALTVNSKKFFLVREVI